VTDRPAEASIYPAAGGVSSDSAVQEVYWRAIVVFYTSARVNNSTLRLMFFTNGEPPVVAGHSVRALLEALGVEIRIVPMSRRISRPQVTHWGNVLYFIDVLDALAQEDRDTRIVLTDCDVVVAGPVDGVFAELGSHEFVGYVLDRPATELINGIDRLEMTALAGEIFGTRFDTPIRHFGGELFATTIAAWLRHRHLFHDLFARAQAGGPFVNVCTEEHFFSIVFAGIPDSVAEARGAIKRMWTARTVRTVERGDELLPLWHLPAEKRYGIRYLFDALAARRFALPPPAQFRRTAQKYCGIPHAGLAKIARDYGVRAIRMGRRK